MKKKIKENLEDPPKEESLLQAIKDNDIEKIKKWKKKAKGGEIVRIM